MITGYLCGQCRDDRGVSVLLNNCVSCGYANILLIITLGNYISLHNLQLLLYTNTVIVDVVVITGLLLSTCITMSPWFYPSLYYLQVPYTYVYTQYSYILK